MTMMAETKIWICRVCNCPLPAYGEGRFDPDHREGQAPSYLHAECYSIALDAQRRRNARRWRATEEANAAMLQLLARARKCWAAGDVGGVMSAVEQCVVIADAIEAESR